MQALVEGIDQPESTSKQMDSADATTPNAAHAIGYLVMNVAGAELRLESHRVFAFVESASNSALELIEPAPENLFHLKSFRDQGA
jgi:hypothetical protein